MAGKVLFVASAMLVLITISVPALAQPLAISHEGFLLDDAGLPLQGAVQLRLSLYDRAVGGAALWWEDRQVTLVD